jgi:DnaJ-class molecular chaperone
MAGSDDTRAAGAAVPGDRGDEASSEDSQTAENTCRRCRGTGRAADGPCPDCGGSGKVVETVGDA